MERALYELGWVSRYSVGLYREKGNSWVLYIELDNIGASARCPHMELLISRLLSFQMLGCVHEQIYLLVLITVPSAFMLHIAASLGPVHDSMALRHPLRLTVLRKYRVSQSSRNRVEPWLIVMWRAPPDSPFQHRHSQC